MHLILVLLNALAFWLAADPAHAGPVAAAFAAVGSVLSAGGIGGAIAKLVIGLAVNFGLGRLQQALTKKNRQKQDPRGIIIEARMGDEQPIGFIPGKYATGGVRKYLGTWGNDGETPNAFVTDVIEIGSMPNYAGPYGLTSVWINDQECAVLWDQPEADGRGYPIAQFRKPDGPPTLWIKFLDGTQTSVDPFLREKFGDNADRPFKETMIGRGCQVVILTARYDAEIFSGVPQGVYEPHPLPLYDLRKDSTNGGSGSHRWGDPLTYESTTNPIVMAYNIIRGIYYGDEWMFGGQNLAAFRLPASSWMAAANECDVIVTRADGTQEPQFRAGIEIRGDMTPLDVISDLMEACNGRIAEVGGVFKVLVGAPGGAVYSFSDDDVVVTKGQSFEPFPSLDEIYNGIEATYPEPAERWAMKNAPPRYSSDYEADDGDRRLPEGIEFAAVPFGAQVQQLMQTLIDEERRFREHSFFLPPDAYALEPNDVVSWTTSRQGYINKKFLVKQIGGDPTFCQQVLLKEIDPNDYDWSSDKELPSSVGWLGRIEAPVQQMTGWSVEPATVTDANGVPRRPAIKISCAPNLDDVVRVWVQVRVKDTGDLVFDSDSNAYASPYAWLISGGWTLSATEYEARGRYVPYTARPTAWGEWLSVTTPDLRLSYADLAADILAALSVLQEWINDGLAEQIEANAAAILAEAQARIDAIEEQAAALAAETAERVADALERADRFRAILSDIEALRDYVAEADFGHFEKIEELRTTLVARIGDVSASFDERITVAVSDLAALAQRTTVLEASTEELEASITSVELASVSRDEALATRMDLLSAGTDNQFDPTKLWRFDASVEGWTSNLGASVSNGYLRVGNGSAPQALSPSGLAVSANTDRQVRARLRKIGEPGWLGEIWWRSSTQTFDEAQSLTIDEPLFDPNGIGLITWTMPWTGTIDQIRIDLSADQTATDGFEIDWIAIGSPSPGASRAELLAEQQARASGDQANAQSITALQALLQAANGEIDALASGVSALTSDVQTLEDGLNAQAQALTSVQAALEETASADALATLQAQVSSLGIDGLVSQGEAITALRGEISDLTAEVADQGFAAFLQQNDVRNALTTASQSLTTRIEIGEGSLSLLAQAVTTLQVALPGLASVDALQSLTTRIDQAGVDSIALQGQSLTSIRSELADLTAEVADQGFAAFLQQNNVRGAVTTATQTLTTKIEATDSSLTLLAEALTQVQAILPDLAEAQALQALTSRVTLTENAIEANSTAITAISAELTGKASSDALNLLQATVTQQGETLTAQGQAITSVQSSLGSKADAQAFNALYTQVQNVNGTVSAQGNSLNELGATVGDVTAYSRFRMAVYADGSGGFARLGLQARVNSGLGWREAGMFIDVPTDASPSRVLFYANQLAFIDNGVVPFAIDNGIAYLKDVNIERATIGTLQVGRSNIQQGAISRVDFNNQGTVEIPLGTWAVVGQTAYHGLGSPHVFVHVSFSLYSSGYSHPSETRPMVAVNILLWDDANGGYTASIPLSFEGATHFSHQYVFRVPEGRTQTTFRADVQFLNVGAALNSNLFVANRQMQCLTLHRMP